MSSDCPVRKTQMWKEEFLKMLMTFNINVNDYQCSIHTAFDYYSEP